MTNNSNHFLLLLQVRWQLFLNSLRRRNRQAELALQSISTLFMTALVLGLAAGAFFGTIAALESKHNWVIDLLLWVVFGIWQLGPVLFEGSAPGLNFREISRYPVSFRLYFLLNTAYGLFDPVALSSMLWLFCIWMGILIARGDLALIAVAGFSIFALLNILCNRFVLGLMERFQSTRRGREIMAIVITIIAVTPQMLQFGMRRWTETHAVRHAAPALSPYLATIHALTPPGITSQILFLPLQQKLLPAALLASQVLLAGFLLLLQSRAVYKGEIHAEGFAAKRKRKIQLGWRLPGIDETLVTIVEKEFHYVTQNMRLLFNLLYPFLYFFLIFGSNRVFTGLRKTTMLGAVAGILLMNVSNMAYNIFGMDASGFERWLLLPFSTRKILLGKNLMCGTLFASLFLIIGTAMLVFMKLPLLSVATITATFFGFLLVQLGAGNLFSAYWPRRVDLTRITRSSSKATDAIAILPILAMAAITAILWALGTFSNLPWLPFLVAIAVLAICIKLYLGFVNRAAAYVDAHLEDIESALCR